MFDLSARAVGFYAALAFPLALLCAIPFVNQGVFDEMTERRYLRGAWVLVVLAPIHVLFPLTALGMARDAARRTTDHRRREDERRRLAAASLGGLLVAITVFVVVATAMS